MLGLAMGRIWWQCNLPAFSKLPPGSQQINALPGKAIAAPEHAALCSPMSDILCAACSAAPHFVCSCS